MIKIHFLRKKIDFHLSPRRFTRTLMSFFYSSLLLLHKGTIHHKRIKSMKTSYNNITEEEKENLKVFLSSGR
jgi:hypothetical protein